MRLELGNETALTQAISGLGGVGKTQIAAEFAYRQRNVYETILWVDAESEGSLANSVSEITLLPDLPQKDRTKEKLFYKRFRDG